MYHAQVYVHLCSSHMLKLHPDCHTSNVVNSIKTIIAFMGIQLIVVLSAWPLPTYTMNLFYQ